MSVDSSAVHESIKLALDAADAATDVTTEYNRVKREHKNLEAKVKQIHRYTTIIFSVSIGTAILAILLTSLLYFRSLSELSVMTKTSREALVVFAENVEKVNSSLSKLDSALSDQTELLVVNRQLTESIDGLKGSVSNSNDQLIIELRAMTSEISDTKSEIQEVVASSVNSQTKSIKTEIKNQISGAAGETNAALTNIESKIKNDSSDSLRKINLNQAAIISSLQTVSSQNEEIKKRFEENQDRISFP